MRVCYKIGHGSKGGGDGSGYKCGDGGSSGKCGVWWLERRGNNGDRSGGSNNGSSCGGNNGGNNDSGCVRLVFVGVNEVINRSKRLNNVNFDN